jgi:hypothetical protein
MKFHNIHPRLGCALFSHSRFGPSECSMAGGPNPNNNKNNNIPITHYYFNRDIGREEATNNNKDRQPDIAPAPRFAETV